LHRYCLLKHIADRTIDRRTEMMVDDEDERSYWMTLRTRQDTGN
jgi:hypothetical protein